MGCVHSLSANSQTLKWDWVLPPSSPISHRLYCSTFFLSSQPRKCNSFKKYDVTQRDLTLSKVETEMPWARGSKCLTDMGSQCVYAESLNISTPALWVCSSRAGRFAHTWDPQDLMVFRAFTTLKCCNSMVREDSCLRRHLPKKTASTFKDTITFWILHFS